MSTFVLNRTVVHIPAWVHDLASFRRWAYSDEFPEAGQICFLDGDVWVDMTMEQIFDHNQVKNEFAFVLTGLAKAGKLGRFLPDGVRLTHAAANLSCEPDGTFVSRESWRTGKVRLVEGAEEGFIELEGTPDMVLEIVSPSTETKDTEVLRELYSRAEIAEYWLVDVRGDRLAFDILRHTAKGYVATRKSAGWVKSAVFGKSFRLTRQQDELKHPEYTLAVRPQD